MTNPWAPVLTVRGVDCPDCIAYLFRDGVWGYMRLRGACASVGIEHDKDTDQMMREYIQAHHDGGHRD